MVQAGIPSMISYLTRLTIVILLAAPALGTAGRANAQPSVQQVPLNPELVKRFLTTYPELQSLSKKYNKSQSKSGNENPLEALSSFMTHHEARKDMQSVLSAHGFSGFPDWIKVAGSVALAYGFAKSGKSADDLGAQANDAIAQIRNHPQMTEQQKAQMIELLERQRGVVAQFKPLPGNVTLVKSMMTEIAAVMDSKSP